MHFLRSMPLFRLRLFIIYQAPHSKALVPACGALVFPTHQKLKAIIGVCFNLSSAEINTLSMGESKNLILTAIYRSIKYI